MNILHKGREERNLLKKGDIGRYVVQRGFRRVTLIPFLKVRISQEDIFEGFG